MGDSREGKILVVPAMSIPSPERQIEFLTNIQRLLGEGAFVATYKYAFLMALADISVAHVDHFIPWSRYPMDLGHNFVLAHGSCNNKKSDRLACSQHLDRWIERTELHSAELASRFEGSGIVYDLPSSFRIANWAYTQTFDCHGLTWVRGDELLALEPEWNRSLTRLLN